MHTARNILLTLAALAAMGAVAELVAFIARTLQHGRFARMKQKSRDHFDTLPDSPLKRKLLDVADAEPGQLHSHRIKAQVLSELAGEDARRAARAKRKSK